CPGTLASMPKALSPRRGQPRSAKPPTSGLPREVVAELRRVARPGRSDQAIADLERAVTLLDRGDSKGAAAEATKAKRAASRSPAVREVLGLALYGQGRYREALSLLRRVRTREDVARPEVLRVWYVTADILARSGRRAEAVREFKKILRHDAGAFDVAERLDQLA